MASQNSPHGPAWDPKQTGVTRTRLVLLRHGQTPFSVQGRYAGRQNIPLTDHGREQAAAAGRWIGEHYPVDCAVISPLLRCQQTAEAAVAAGAAGIPAASVPSPGVERSAGATVTTPGQGAGAAVATEGGDRSAGATVTTPEHCAGAASSPDIRTAPTTPVSSLDALMEMDFGEWDGKTYAEVREQWGAVQREWYADWAMPAPGGESIEQVFHRVIPAVRELATTYPEHTVLVVSHVTPIKSILRWALDASPEFYVRFHLDTASVSIVDLFSDGGVCANLLNATPR